MEETKSNDGIVEETDNSLDTKTEKSQDVSKEEILKTIDNTKKKVPVLNKILFIAIGLLLSILLIGSILFFSGFFNDEKPIEKVVTKKEVITQKQEIFNIQDINSKKLNEQLSLLTNKNIIQEEEINNLEKEKEENRIKEEAELNRKNALIKEEEKLAQESIALENKTIELEKQRKELELLKSEAIALRDILIENKNDIENNSKPEEKQVITNNTVFVSLINVAKIKGELYKSYLDKVSAIYSDLHLCRDDLNRIEIYYGPFNDEKLRSKVYNELQEKGIINSYEVELTKEEFYKRCNY